MREIFWEEMQDEDDPDNRAQSVFRTHVPKGWLLRDSTGRVVYVPDPEHDWEVD